MVSVEAAREMYGVAVDETSRELDAATTVRLRKKMGTGSK